METKGVKEKYLEVWIKDKDSEQRRTDNERAFETVSRFFSEILGKSFSGDFVDLGCGDGSFYKLCIEKGLNASGLDISDGIDFEKDKLPFKDQSLDIVMLYSVIEHIWNPSMLLEEIKRVLRPTGVVFFVVPNIDYCGTSFYNDHTHIKPYNSPGLQRMMKSYSYQKLFCGLWTVGKPTSIWRWSEKWQYRYGKWLPFTGRNKNAPSFLKGKSVTMLCAFSPELKASQ